MTDSYEKQLGETFVDLLKTLPHEEVIRGYRALDLQGRLALEAYAYDESIAALNSTEPDAERLELLARCFDVFADADDVEPPLSSADLFRKRADALRHPEEWRKAPKPDQPSEGRLQALALASSCWSDDPQDVRLRRIEEVLPQLNQLADQAVAEGRLSEESAIGEDIVGLWRLRDALRADP